MNYVIRGRWDDAASFVNAVDETELARAIEDFAEMEGITFDEVEVYRLGPKMKVTWHIDVTEESHAD